MELPAFRLTQEASVNTTTFYIATMPAFELVKRHELDRWTPGNIRGYQRLPHESRFDQKPGTIVRYLNKDLGCFPTSILINVRGELTYTEDQNIGWSSVGILEIGDDERLWLLDGQHRVEALSRMIEARPDKFEDYPVLVSVLNLSKRFEELMYFYIVNRRQKSVPLDLVYRHLQLMLKERGETWLLEFEGKKGLNRGKATEIVDMLNENPNSVWRGRIRRVTETRRDEHIIRDYLLIKVIADIVASPGCDGLTNEELADLLVDFWNGVSRLYPEAFTHPREYTLLGAQGVISLHRVFPHVYRACAAGGLVNEARMTECLMRLKKETPDHVNPLFREPIGVRHWSKELGPVDFIKTDRVSIEELFRNLLEKITAEPGS